jgi:hypothetical protein
MVILLAMVSLANASLQISVNGEKNLVESYTVPSQTLTLGIWTNTNMTDAGTTTWALVVSPYMGVMGGSGHYVGPAGTYFDPVDSSNQDNFTSTMYNNLTGIASIINGVYPGAQGIQGTVTIWKSGIIPDSDPQMSYPSIPASTQLFDGIVYHSEAGGDHLIRLYTMSGTTATLCDTVINHDIPEPATLLLLGLGGMILKSKKSKGKR